MTHERCSELLGGFVRGELSQEDAAGVRAHLDGCEECRAEERAIVALTSGEGPAGRPLDDFERARLHRGLAQELFTAQANADVAGAGPRATPRWARWGGVAVAGAAVLAAVAVMTTLGGGSDETAQLGAQAPAEAGADEGSATDNYGGGSAGGGNGGDGGKAVRGSAPESSKALDASAQEGATADAAGPSPQFHSDLGSVTSADVPAIGAGFRPFADAYSPGEAAGLYDRFLRILTTDSAGAADQVEQCAATLPQDGSLVPVYAGLADYEGEDALLLGFVTSDPGSKELDRYLLWVWSRGSCEQPIDTFFETIDGD